MLLSERVGAESGLQHNIQVAHHFLPGRLRTAHVWRIQGLKKYG